MTTSATSAASAASASLLSGGSTGLSQLYASATKSLSARDRGLKALDAHIGRDQSNLSGLGKLVAALDGFQSLAGTLSGGGLALAAGASGSALGAQLSGSGATVGTHAVEVRQLAQAQQLTSTVLPSGSAPLGTGTATLIQVASGSGAAAQTVTVRIDAGANTLDGIAKALKDAGLDAQVSKSGAGYALNLSGKSGAANAMHISVSGDPVLQALLSYQPGARSAMTQTAAAQDAQLTVDGKPVASPTNQVGAAIPGVTLSLSATGGSQVTVGADDAAVGTNVRQIVDAYNGLNGKLVALKTANADNAGVIDGVRKQLAAIVGGADAHALAQAGITQKNGSLVLDDAKLKAALAADPAQVARLFSNGGSGLADRLAAAVSQQTASGGALATQTTGIRQDMDKLSAQKTTTSNAIGRQAALLVQQYSQAGSGTGGLFGAVGSAMPTSLFDYLA